MTHLYFDYNATAPIAPQCQQAMEPFLTRHHGNPSSSHGPGRFCQEAVQQAREQVAGLLGAQADEIVFTSGGTESNNLALRSGMSASGLRRVITTRVEHPSVLEFCRRVASEGDTEALAGFVKRGVTAVLF